MFKIFHTNLDLNNPIDGTVRARYIPLLGTFNLTQSDVVFIWLTWQRSFEFDSDTFERIKSLGKKVVICDFTEFGWEMDDAPYYGFIEESAHVEKFSKEQLKLNQIKELNVITYFKRELFENEETPDIYKDKVYPIDYMAYDTSVDYGITHFEKFKKRQHKLFSTWGLSNPVRPRVHAQLIELLNHGYNVCDNLEYLNKETYDIITLYRPHHTRIPMDKVFEIQRESKMSLSLQGCGKKCFRHSEASKNSVMVHTDTKMVWAFNWDRGNSIIIPQEPTIEDFKQLLQIPDEKLYDIYVNGVMNHRNYLPETYIPYIWQSVANHL